MNLGQENAGVPQGLLISSQTDLPELLRQKDQIPMALVHFRPPFGDACFRQAESLVTEPQKILQRFQQTLDAPTEAAADKIAAPP